jgi:hypothetical protein
MFCDDPAGSVMRRRRFFLTNPTLSQLLYGRQRPGPRWGFVVEGLELVMVVDQLVRAGAEAVRVAKAAALCAKLVVPQASFAEHEARPDGLNREAAVHG